jgi:hypothetical protein
MNLQRLLHQPLGQFFISVLLGLGLASLFKKVCTDKNCIRFRGPPLQEIDGKIFKQGEKCVSYTRSSMESCDNSKKIVEVGSSDEPSQSVNSSKPRPVEAYMNWTSFR